MSSYSNDDRFLVLVLEICSDLGSRLYAVHHGHAEVCKDDTVPHSILIGLFDLRKSFFPVDAEVSLKVSVDAQRVQDSTHRGDAKLLVVDHQDSVV